MFLYFDLGKVLLDFSVERMCQQIGDVAGVAAARVKEVVFAPPARALNGRITTGNFMKRLPGDRYEGRLCGVDAGRERHLFAQHEHAASD